MAINRIGAVALFLWRMQAGWQIRVRFTGRWSCHEK